MNPILPFSFKTSGSLLLLNGGNGDIIREVSFTPSPHNGYNIRTRFNHDGKLTYYLEFPIVIISNYFFVLQTKIIFI